MTLPTLQSLYEEHDARWLFYHVRIGGALLPQVTSIDYGFAMGSAPTCSIRVPIQFLPAAVEEEASVEVWVGFRVGLVALETLVFGGAIVASVGHENADVVVSCVQDGARRLTTPYNRTIDYTFTSVDASAAATSFLESAGVANYFVDLPSWTIGAVTHPMLQFSTWGDAINKIATVDGSPWYSLPSGQVRVEVRDPFPADTGRRQYFTALLAATVETQPTGVSNPAARPRILDATFTPDREAVANWIEVDGANIVTVGPRGEQNSNQIIENDEGDSGRFPNGAPWVPIPPTFQQLTYSNELIDQTAKAATVAERYYSLGNRLLDKGQITVPLDPDVFLGETIELFDPQFTGRVARYFVMAYHSTLSAGQSETTLTLQGGVQSGTTGHLSPFAEFIWSYNQIHNISPAVKHTWEKTILGYQAQLGAKLCQVVPAGTGTLEQGADFTPGEDKPMVILTFNGALSQDFDGHIVSWAWSDDQGHSGSGPFFTVMYDALAVSVVQVSLTVTDNDGLTQSITKTCYTSADYLSPTTPDPTLNDTKIGGGVVSGPCSVGGSQGVNGGGGGGGGTGIGAAVPPDPADAPPAIGQGPGGANGMALGYVAAAGCTGMASGDGINWDDLLASDTGAAGSFISVATFPNFQNQHVYILYGTDAGEIVLSADFNRSGFVAFVGTGRIECIHYDDHEDGRVWAGSSTGQLYTSLDFGVTWALYYDFGDGLPIYVIGTPPRFFPGDNLSLWIFGGDASQPGSLIRIDGNKTGSFVSLPLGRDLLAALAGQSGAVRTSTMNETASLIGFSGSVDPPAWTADDPVGDPDSWTPCGGAGFTGPAQASAPGAGGDFIVSADTNIFTTTDNNGFLPGSTPTPIADIAWQGLDGVYLAAGADGILESVDKGATWGYVRPNATLGSTWPGCAVGYQVAFIVYPRPLPLVIMGSFGHGGPIPD